MAFKYIISNWVYGEEDLKVTFDRLQRFGYDGIELMGEPEKYNNAEIKTLVKKTGVKVMTLAGIYTAERDLSDPDHSIRANAVKYVKDCCDFANDLGAEVVIVVPSEVTRTKPHNCNPLDEYDWLRAFDEEWKYAVESIGEAGLYAEKKGVMLAIEPANRFEVLLVNTGEQGLKMMNEVNLSSVKLHLDTFHMNIEDANPANSIRQAGSALINFHVADSNRQAVGEGHIDWDAHVKALIDIGYIRTLSLEPLPPVADTYLAANIQRFKPLRDEYAKLSIERLKEIEKRCLK
jgi:sugar phosphate isomerase/epimerase